ncbi:MAG: hypothetical protein IJN88_03475, partial [Clostridia bacterium]|nr:hypothetical protein [Clostridia bacterium]
LGSCVARRAGSTPVTRTKIPSRETWNFLLCLQDIAPFSDTSDADIITADKRTSFKEIELYTVPGEKRKCIELKCCCNLPDSLTFPQKYCKIINRKKRVRRKIQ